MADKYHITTEFYDFNIGSQLTQYTDHSEVNEHANAEMGWDEHLERIQLDNPPSDLYVRWFVYNSNKNGGKGHPLVVSFFEYYNTCWQQIADREGLTIVAFEYHKNSRIPAGGRGTLGFGPREDEIATYHEVIERVIKEHECDRERLYVSGLSYGDMTTVIYTAKYGKEIAGIATINGPSSYYNIEHFGMDKQTAVPCIQFRSDDDYTCDGFPWPDYDDPAGAKAFVHDIRSLQTVMNRDIWIKANGIEDLHPVFSSERHFMFAVYPGETADCIYTEVFKHCHIVPIDAAEYMWKALFSRYKRLADGTLVKIAPMGLDADCNIAVAVGSGKAYVNNEVVQLSAPVLMLCPPEKVTRDSYSYHRSEDTYPTVYAPLDILSEGFCIDYTVRDKAKTLSTHVYANVVAPEIDVKDSVVEFWFGGAKYEVWTNCDIVIRDGKVIDLTRPPFWINGQIYIPVEEFAKLLGLNTSRNEDTVYITDHEMQLGYTIGRLIREEILSEREENPVSRIEVLPYENCSVELSADTVPRGYEVYVNVKPAEGYHLENVEAIVNGCPMPSYRMSDNQYYICNVMKDIKVKVTVTKE